MQTLNGAEVWVRTADATLVAKDVRPLVAGSPFTAGTFVSVRARSSVEVETRRGPFECEFHLLDDTDPARPCFDKLLVARSGFLAGTLDLATAAEGYAMAEGRWTSDADTGTFRARFLLPFALPSREGFWYAAHDDDGMSRTGPDAAPRALAPDEFALGMPLTKVVVTAYADSGPA